MKNTPKDLRKVIRRSKVAKALALKQYQPQRTPNKREFINKLVSKHAHRTGEPT